MTFTLLPGVVPFVVAMGVVALVALALLVPAVVELGTSLRRNHTVRVRRHESILHYYGHLALGH